MADLARLVVTLEAQTAKYQKGLDSANRKLDRFEKRQGKALDRVKRGFSSLGQAVAAFGAGLAIREVARAGVMFEGFDAALKAATGSAEGAADAMSFVRSESQRLGIDLASSAQAFTKLTAAARGTSLEGAAARDIFTAVAEASRVMNLSADQTAGALTAIEQIISKGKVSAEELRGQLGERLPGAFQIAARAIGKTTQELDKMLSNGELLAEDLLPALAVELRKTVAGGLPDAVDSAAASFARFSNSILELKNSIAQSGVLNLLASLADKATMVVKGLQILTTGKGGNKIVDTDNELRELEGTLARLERSANDPKFFSLFENIDGKINFFPSNAELNSEIERVKAQIASKRQELETLLNPSVIAPTSNAQTSGVTGGGGVAKATKARVDPIKKAIEALETEAAQLGMNAQQAQLYELKLKGASKAQIERARAAITAIESQSEAERLLADELSIEEEAMEARRDKITRATENAKTANDKYNESLAELQQLLADGDISFAVFQANVVKLNDEFDRFGEKKEEFKEFTAFADQAARNIQDQFADFLFNPFEDGLKGMLKGFRQTLARMAAEAVAQAALMAVLNSVSGGTAGLFAGFFAKGGTIPQGQFGVVGENGPELVAAGAGGAHVTPMGTGGNITVNLHEDASKAGRVNRRDTGGQMEVDVFVSDIRGSGDRSRALEQTYGLQRVGR